MKRFFSVILCLIITLTMAFASGSAAFASVSIDSNDIVVLYTNDVHCNVTSSSSTMGYADVAGYKEYVKGLTNNVSLVDSGDAIQGGAMGTLSKGELIAQIMNQTGYEVCTYGNHEFDYGMTQLNSLVSKSSAKYVSCNFTNLKTNKTVSDSYTIINYNGTKIAYVGISTPYSLTTSTPKNFQDGNGNYIYGFCQDDTGEKLYSTVQNAVNSAKSDGADYVVALAHLGVSNEYNKYSSSEVIKNTIGIDVMLDGHSHTVIQSQNVANKNGKNVILTSTGTKLANLGELVIDTNGTSTTSDDTLSTKLLSASELTDKYQNTAYTQTKSKVEDSTKEFNELLSKVVATSSVNLTLKKPSGYRGIRDRETNMGDFVADAYRTVLGADIGITNGGGVRADIPAGNVTYGDIINVHPYGNTMCEVKATGQEIINALEFASRKTSSNTEDSTTGYTTDENGGFLQVSGIKYTIDTTVPTSVETDANGMFKDIAGAYRVKNVLVYDKTSGFYLPIEPTKKYTVASSNYVIKNSGDGMNIFADNELFQDEVLIDNQCLINYITDNLLGNIGSQYSEITGQGRIKVLTSAHTDSDCTFGDWQVVKEATPTSDGLKIRYCTVCGKAETMTYKYAAKTTETTTSETDTTTQTNDAISNKEDSTTTTKSSSSSKEGKSPNTGNNEILLIYGMTFIITGGILLLIYKKKKCK